MDDLKSREVTLGSQGVGNRSYLYSRLMAEVLGLKVRWVLGYDTLQLYVAMEQGEVQGRVNDAASMMTDKPEWFANREIVALLAMTLPEELPPVKHPMFEGVPSIMQFAKTDVQKNIIQKINSTDRLGAAMAFPPGTPEAIRKIMEEALLKVGKDPAFRKDWEEVVLEGIAFEQMFTGKESFRRRENLYRLAARNPEHVQDGWRTKRQSSGIAFLRVLRVERGQICFWLLT